MNRLEKCLNMSILDPKMKYFPHFGHNNNFAKYKKKNHFHLLFNSCHQVQLQKIAWI